MALLSWADHLEAEMALVHVKAIRGFVFAGKIIEPGEIAQVEKSLARQLVHGAQAQIVPDPATVAPSPSPAIVTQQPAVETQRPTLTTRKSKD